MLLYLTFIDLKKPFDTVETEAYGVCMDGVIIEKKRRVPQRDTISPDTLDATLENAMRGLEWENMGMKVDGGHSHHLRFAADILLITSSINQEEGKCSRRTDGFLIIHSCSTEKYIRMLQLCASNARNQHDERPDLRAEQKETSGLWSIQEHRGCSEVD
ncbi:hypothetical protein RB195_024909 [Necator americanus]|uniref:Reverse transcriptase domain-containing protein n=1 Tax=Necator americanus TaxID=51031 RepID=A0ABR1EQ78_NECAM